MPSARARRAKELIQNAAPNAAAALEDYLFTFADEMEKFRIVKDKEKEFDDQIIESLGQELPYRNEYIEILTLAARYWNAIFVEKIHRFFERIAVYQFRPPETRSWSEWDYDNYHFIANELFLYTISILVRSERMPETGDLLDQYYYLGEVAPERQEPMTNFTIF